MKKTTASRDTLNDLHKLVLLVKNRSPLFSKVLLSEKGDRNSPKLTQLYQYLLNNKQVSDAEAATKLYGSHPQHKAYQMLKTLMRKRLVRGLLLLDTTLYPYSPVFKAGLRAMRNLHGARLLIRFGGRAHAELLLKQTLSEAGAFQLVESQQQAAYQLRQHYSVTGKSRQFLQLQKQIQQIDKQVNALRECAYYLELYDAQTKRGGSLHKKLLPRLAVQQKRAAALCKKYPLEEIKQYGFRLAFYRWELAGKSAKAAAVCKQAAAACRQAGTLLPAEREGEWLLREMALCYDLRLNDAARQCYQRAQQVFKLGTVNYFTLQEVYIRLQLRTGHYSAAYQCHQSCLPALKTAKRQTYNAHAWQMFDTYLALLALAHQFPRVAKQTKFDYTQLLTTDYPAISDKQGLGVPLLVAQVLFRLFSKDYESLQPFVPRLTALVRKYRYRKKDMQRSVVFMQLLLCVIRYRLFPKTFQRKAARLLRLLSGQHRKLNDTAEWLDYEALWQMIPTK